MCIFWTVIHTFMDLCNDSKLSTSRRTTEREKSRKEDSENKENMSQLFEQEKSHVSSISKESNDIVTPVEKEEQISPNLTGTAVKNSVASTEPTPQFFGSKKRLFPSSKIADITSETITKVEEEVDIVGLSDDEEMDAQCHQKPNDPQKEKGTSMTTTDDSIVVDVDDEDTPCITFNDKSKGSKVKGGVQEDEKATGGRPQDDTVIVDVEDENTFVTLGNKSKVSMLKGGSHDQTVPDNEESYQMDESAVLEGTKHKAMSPEFGSVSNHISRSSTTENDENEDVAKPKGRQTRKSKKSVIKKSFKEQEREEEENENDDADELVDQQAVKKTTRRSKKSVSNKSMKEKQHQRQENLTVDLTSTDQTNVEDDTSHVKKTTRNSKKSVSNKSMKGKSEEDEFQQDISVNIKRADHTNDDDTSHVSRVTRNTKKSVSSKSMEKKLEEDEIQQDVSVNITSADHTNDDDTSNVSRVTRNTKKSVSSKSMDQEQDEMQNNISVNITSAKQTNEDHTDHARKATRKSKKSVSNKSIKEKQLEEHTDEFSSDVIANETTTKRGKRKSTRTKQDEDNENAADVEEKPEERVMTRRATRSNTSNHVSITSTSDKTLKNVKKPSAQGRRTTRSKGNRSTTANKGSVSGESESEQSGSEGKSMGAGDEVEHEAQGEDGGNMSAALEMEDGIPAEIEHEVDDTEVHDAQGEDEEIDILEDGASNRRLTRNKLQAKLGEADGIGVEEEGGNGGSDDDGDGDDEQESQGNGNRPTKISKTKGRKVGDKGAAWRAMLNNQGSDSNHDDDDDNDDVDFDEDDDARDDDVHDDDDDGDKNDNKDGNEDENDSETTSKIVTKSKNRKKSASSSSASESDKDGVDGKKQQRKRKRKYSKVSLTRNSRRKPRKNDTTATGNDVTDQDTADEGDDERNNATNKDTVEKTMTKSSRKRTNQTRTESIQAAHSSTPVVLNGSPYVLPPGSVKSILKSSIPRSLSVDAKKRRVSIATNKKGPTSGADDDDEVDGNDEGGKSKSHRQRKSSVSFAPTPSFHISPDDFSTLSESPGGVSKLSFVTNFSSFSSGENTFTPGVLSSASLSSSVSSLGSNPDLLSDSSTVNESQEITINKSKRKQIEEEVTDDSGVRRSKRTKVPPLEYWKNERIKYERRQSGWFVSGIEKVPTPAPRKRKTKKLKKEKKAIRRESLETEAEGDEDYEQPADMEEITYTSIPVVNPDNGEQVELDLVHTPEMLSFVNASGKPAKPEDELIVDKYMSHNLFGTGQIVLRPGAEKGKQHVRADTMVFYVVKGRVEVTVHETTVLLRTGSTFFVPTGNWYNIKNAQNSDAKLYFVQIKG